MQTIEQSSLTHEQAMLTSALWCVVKRREAKARARSRKAAARPIPLLRTHCANGHPEDRNAAGKCRACLRASKKCHRETLATQRALKSALTPKAPALTSAQKRAADPKGYRDKERASEAKRLGKPVLTLEEYLQAHASARTPEQKREVQREASKRSRKKKKALRVPKSPKTPKTHCYMGHLRTPENLTGNGTCRLCDKIQGVGRRSRQRALEGTDYKIYALVDPWGPEVFYVGCTITPKSRLQKHIHYGNSKRAVNPEVGQRIADIKAAGLGLTMVILERTEDFNQEDVWIEFLRPYGILNSAKRPYPYNMAYRIRDYSAV